MSEQKIIEGDCLEVMKTLDSGSIDAIITDPPYNLDYKGRGKNLKHEKFANDSSDESEYEEFVGRVTLEMGRVAKETACMYLFIDWRNYPLWARYIAKDFAPVKNCIVWVKQGIGLGQFYRFQHEFCIFSVRGGYHLNRHDVSDVWNESRESTSHYLHPTQKPTNLLMKAINHLPDNENIKILDPFMGSGSTILAAKMLKRNAIGIELDPKYCQIARNRLSQDTLF